MPNSPINTPRCLASMLSLLLTLSGCAVYHRDPLSSAAGDTALSMTDLHHIRIDTTMMPLPELAAHRFDLSDGLDIEETAMLAVANNPDLKLARDDLGIARAQAFSAGLLPDPQLAISNDYPAALGLSRAFSYGLSIDAMALITRNANRRAADATVVKTDLGLLWQEWQVVAQAKMLFSKSIFQQSTLPLLQRQRSLALTRYQRLAEARRDGDTTDDVVMPALTAWQDAEKQYTDAQRTAEQTHHDLNALLGVAAEVQLPLVASTDIQPLPAATLDQAVAQLDRRRPDLLALRAGYEAQEQKYRAAIIGQFPSLQIGFVRGRDTSEIYTSGFQVSLSLPIFNRNRGNIAIEKSTRQRLRDEYRIRMSQAQADVTHARADLDILTASLDRARATLPTLDRVAQHAQQAYDAHDVPLGTYVDAQLAALTRRIDIDTLAQTLAEQRVALQALLGSAIPDALSDAISADPHALHDAPPSHAAGDSRATSSFTALDAHVAEPDIQ